MRRLFLTLFLGTTLSAFAQQGPKLEPIPEPPPPPPGMVDESPEPQVTIVRKGEDKVEEYRMNGHLYMMKVTPPDGVPYYLVDEQGNGSWAKKSATDSGIRVPMWVIGTF
ncbi:MAG TPA: DUF2782 domain-containing protein [Rhodocyclaceae bacterium]|nr:DUF2782 domain-containing protein [Rhodocyclaceae bacterium]